MCSFQGECGVAAGGVHGGADGVSDGDPAAPAAASHREECGHQTSTTDAAEDGERSGEDAHQLDDTLHVHVPQGWSCLSHTFASTPSCTSKSTSKLSSKAT